MEVLAVKTFAVMSPWRRIRVEQLQIPPMLSLASLRIPAPIEEVK